MRNSTDHLSVETHLFRRASENYARDIWQVPAFGKSNYFYQLRRINGVIRSLSRYATIFEDNKCPMKPALPAQAAGNIAALSPAEPHIEEPACCS
jgi:hypothetical protein